MADWKEIDFDELGKKALDFGKKTTEKSLSVINDWQNDSDRQTKSSERKTAKLNKKELKKIKKQELKATFKLTNKKEFKAKIKQALLGSCILRQKESSLVYFENDDHQREYALISFEWHGPQFVQRSNTTTETTGKKKGIGRAIIGGAIAGPAGAIVGGVTGKSKGSSTSNTSFYQEEVPSKGLIVLKDITDNEKLTLQIKVFAKDAEIISMMSAKNNHTTTEQTSDPFEDVIKFKELLDQGVITEEEFIQKKKELLNL